LHAVQLPKHPEACPAGQITVHTVHAVAPTVDTYVPDAQTVHAVAAETPEYVPILHEIHAPALSTPHPDALPAGQTTLAEHTVAPFIEAYVPYAQAVQAVAPDTAAYVPFLHKVQFPGLEPPQPDDCPAEQFIQLKQTVA